MVSLVKCATLALVLAAATPAQADGPPPEEARPKVEIEGLAPPKPARPPHPAGSDEDTLDQDLRRKRKDRRRREKEAEPPPVPWERQQEEALLKETLQPRPRRLLMEVSLVGGAALTTGAKEGYTLDPNSHFNVALRHDPKKNDGRIGLWYGARVAPFTGTGFYKKRPGSYGLTYFGPMIGVGKIDPVPEDDGKGRATAASGEIDIPSADGWLVSAGLAAVTKNGESGTTDASDGTNDFGSKGVAFDAPGAWLEIRYLKILFGGAGLDVVVGTQSGRGKLFVYGGLGFGAWY